MGIALILSVLASLLAASAAIAAPCRDCHGDIASTQLNSRHANTLRPYDGTGFSGKSLRERNGTLYSYDDRKVSITREGVRRETLIQWSFGGGRSARTLVLKQDGQWVEHRITHYPLLGRLRLTPGQLPRPADSFATALGVVQNGLDAERCFACHSTTPGEPGVHCVRCHGNPEDHPRQPTKKDAKAFELCAECHTYPGFEFTTAEPELEDPASIRSPPSAWPPASASGPARAL